MNTSIGTLPDSLEIHCHPEASVMGGELVAAFIDDNDDFFGLENSRPGDLQNHVEVWIDNIRYVDEVAHTHEEMVALIRRSIEARDA